MSPSEPLSDPTGGQLSAADGSAGVLESGQADRPPGLAGRLFSLAGAGSVLALFDQGIVSATRFVTSIIIGRILGPADLGLYAVAFAILLFAMSVQESLITRPYTVYGQRLKARDLRQYAGSILVHHGVLVVVSTLLVCLLGLMVMGSGIWPPEMGRVILVLAAIIPFTLLWDFARRIAFAHLRMTEAVVLDTALAVLQLGLLLALAFWESLDLETALGAMAVAAAVVGLAWLFVWWKQCAFRASALWRDWRQNWNFGRWILAGQLAATLHGYAAPWILTVTIGAAATGIFVAAQTIVLLSNPLVLGLANWLGPKAAQGYATGGIREVKATIWTVTAVVCLLMALFAFVLLAFGGALLALFFGTEFAGYGLLIAVFGTWPIARVVIVTGTCGLVAMEQSRSVFVGSMLGLVVTLALTVPLSLLWHVMGAVVALLVGSYVTAIFLILAFIWVTHRATVERMCEKWIMR